MNFPADLFSPIDRHLAAFLAEKTGDTSPEFLAACLLTGSSLAEGDSCLEIPAAAGMKLSSLIEKCPAGSDLKLPQLKKWTAALKANPAVGEPGGSPAPLILDNENRLYFYRYYLYEKAIADRIRGFINSLTPPPDTKRLKKMLAALFPSDNKPGAAPDMQKAAAVLASASPFCVISGGPGTGKTSTVVKIIALLADQYLNSGRPFRAALTAPTGKAAARLKESVGASIGSLKLEGAVAEAVPAETYTLHRLLGFAPGMDQPRYNSDNPLPYDLIVADEFSMADLPMAARLFAAVADGARLILLGDRDQLSSVEAGAVFAGICAGAASNGYTPRTVSMASEAGVTLPVDPSALPAADTLALLTKSWRFSDTGGIGAAAADIRAGDSGSLINLLSGSDPALELIEPVPRLHNLPGFSGPALKNFSRYFDTGSAAEALDSMKQFIFLCALKNGWYGAGSVNHSCEIVLADKLKGISSSPGGFYNGRPVMITENDYGVQLFNGDTGLILNGAEGLRAMFKTADGTVRELSPAMLPAHETVYAMTVHKSQGSEFDHAAVVLPDTPHRVLTRELIYTAFTRARTKVTIFGTPEVLASAVASPTRRKSGLADMIRGD